MDFERTEDQERIAEAVRELCRAFPDDYWTEQDQRKEFPWDFYRAMADGGWLGIAVPEAYGGGGLGVQEVAVLLQEVSASGGAMGACSSIHVPLFGLHPVIRHADEAMRQSVLPDAAAGKSMFCFAITEPDVGTDTTSIKTFARRTSDGYVVDGTKVWISNAQNADKVVLLARTTRREDCERPTDGMTLFLTDLDRDAIAMRRIAKMGRNAVDSNELFITDLHVPESAVIGEEGRGFRYLLDGLNAERILLANVAIGIGKASLRRAVQYANERVVFDRPIGRNQAIQHPLAEAAARLEAAELVAQKAAWLYDQGLPCGREANMAKLLAADAGYYAADRAVQTHGGYGYASEFHVERYFREARLIRLGPISQEMVLNYLAEHVLGLPKSY